jgi:hypothetical protein
MAADMSYDSYQNDLSLDKIVADKDHSALLSQSVFRNHRHTWGFVPEKAILVVGPTRLGQKLFEEITHLPGYRADRLLFVLHPSGDLSQGEVRAEFTACITVGDSPVPSGMTHWDREQVRAFYADETMPANARPTRLQYEAERALYQVARSESGQFLFLSQQRFSDWHAYGDGRELPVYKAQAGLTAIYVPAGIEEVEYRYEVPAYEWWARIFSLTGVLTALGWWLAGWPRWKSYSARSPHYTEQMTNGSNTGYGKTAKLVGR